MALGLGRPGKAARLRRRHCILLWKGPALRKRRVLCIVAQVSARATTTFAKPGAPARSLEQAARISLWTLQREDATFVVSKGRSSPHMTAEKQEVLQGTLDLMILKALHALGPQHGFGIARRIEQVSE